MHFVAFYCLSLFKFDGSLLKRTLATDQHFPDHQGRRLLDVHRLDTVSLQPGHYIPPINSLKCIKKTTFLWYVSTPAGFNAAKYQK